MAVPGVLNDSAAVPCESDDFAGDELDVLEKPVKGGRVGVKVNEGGLSSKEEVVSGVEKLHDSLEAAGALAVFTSGSLLRARNFLRTRLVW